MPLETFNAPKIDTLGTIPAVAPVLLVGQLQPLTKNQRSGIAKEPVPGPWRITQTGLAGDVQADLENHGGPEKALLHYARDHYADWRREIGPHRLLEAPGAFGENLSTNGWTEALVHIGDVISLGKVILQVSQGRQPCWKLNYRFERPKMAFEVQNSGRTGWYYRVLEPGAVEPGDLMRIIERPCPDWPLTRLIHVLYKNMGGREALEAMAAIAALAEGWRKIARRRLALDRTEDWTGRLYGAESPP